MGQTQPKVEGPAPIKPDKATEAPSTACVFILGRQHSGNTVLAHLLGRLPGVYARVDENSFFEVRKQIDAIRPAVERAWNVLRSLRIDGTEDNERVLERLRTMAEQNEVVTALDLYLAGMDELTQAAGASVWAQKATSYVFHAREILADVPHAKLIYVLRNPLDLAASEKRRKWTRGYVWGTPKGWKAGLQLADALRRSHPTRFMIVKYEDLATHPEETARRICAFLELDFDARCLDVPRVNPAEAGAYSLTVDDSAPRGLSATKVFTYASTLTELEITAVELMACGPLFDAYYPNWPSQPSRPLARARVLLMVAAVRFAWTYMTRLDRSWGHLLRRTLRRIKGGG